MSIIDMILWQKESYNKCNGHYPKCLLLGRLQDEFFAEFGKRFMADSMIKYENPKDGLRQFEGMNVITTSETYGGNFSWAFGE